MLVLAYIAVAIIVIAFIVASIYFKSDYYKRKKLKKETEWEIQQNAGEDCDEEESKFLID